SILLPYAKPGKDLSHPSSYRPISILPNLGKVLEKMVHRRLSWWMESNSLHLKEQCGFRPGRSVSNVLIQLEQKVQITYRKKGVALACFLDIKSAFDKASHLGILYKISVMGL
ncbi:UNVERIFIED_CONTAM: hypothetical protein GTU68_002664, partial [Idotea baltica]|nr:hypothetical protein [Idotea baltica]